MEKLTTPHFVNLPNGKRTKMLVSGIENKGLCTVSEPVLEFLVSLCPKATMSQIIESFSSRASEIGTQKEWVELLREELDFHESLNLLTEHFATEAKEEKHHSMKVEAIA